jgi:predicted nucleic acid-binding protein
MTQVDAFFDSNVVVYFVSDDAVKSRISDVLLSAGGVISVQVLNEFSNVALRKNRLPFVAVRNTLDAVRAACRVVPLTIETHERGLQYAERYKLGLYDSMIIAAAVLAGCTTLYSEDMHSGLVIDGLTIRNPYAA